MPPTSLLKLESLTGCGKRGVQRGGAPLAVLPEKDGGVPRIQFPSQRALPGQEEGREMLEKGFSATC